MVFSVSAFNDTGIPKEFVHAHGWFQHSAVVEHGFPRIAVFAPGIMQAITIAFEIAKQIDAVALGEEKKVQKEKTEKKKTFFHNCLVRANKR